MDSSPLKPRSSNSIFASGSRPKSPSRIRLEEEEFYHPSNANSKDLRRSARLLKTPQKVTKSSPQKVTDIDSPDENREPSTFDSKSPKRRSRPPKTPTESPRTQLSKSLTNLRIATDLSPMKIRQSRKNLFDSPPKKSLRPSRHRSASARNVIVKPKNETPKKNGRPSTSSKAPIVNAKSLKKLPPESKTPEKRRRPPSVSRRSLPSKAILNNFMPENSPKKLRTCRILASLSAQISPHKANQKNMSPRKRGRPSSLTKRSPSKPKNNCKSPFKERQNTLDFNEDETPPKRSRRALFDSPDSISSRSSSRRSSRQRRLVNVSSSSEGEGISFIQHDDEDEDLIDMLENIDLGPADLFKNVNRAQFSKFVNWTGLDTSTHYTKFMEAVHEQMFNMDHVEKSLNQGLKKVLSGNEGVLFTLYGKAGSGKRTIIHRVFNDSKRYKFVELNGRFAKLTEVKQGLKSVEQLLKTDDKPLVFVLYNFDALRLTFANKVLYTLTNLLRKNPFFLLLVTEKENAVDALEKRIVSRVGQNFIKCMDRRLTVEDCWELVQALVKVGVDACHDPDVEDAFDLSEQPPKYFDRLCNRLPCYSELKLFVKQLADEIFDNLDKDSLRSTSEIARSLLKPIDDHVNRLKCLTDRMYGLLIAAAIKTTHVSKKIPVKHIFQEYRRFLNTKSISSPFLQLKEQDFLDDVEYLVFQRFWVAKRQNQKIIGISWLEDPLKLLSEKYHVLFITDLIQWSKDALKDDAQLR